ncbi:MAG: hypothetical protein ABI862_13435 [Ilumatobacteraceae bacterium]
MIDEAIDTEFEDLLRTTLHEMIPKFVAATRVVEELDGHGPAVVMLRSRTVQTRGSRRLVAAAIAIAATIVGLVVIATRNTDEATPGAAASTVDGVPTWYDMIKPSLPDRFSYVALTFASEAQWFFVAVNPVDGKTLEIQLASGGYSTEPTTTVDATGAWVESAQGWSVKTPSGLFVSVACNIGVGGRDYVGPTNYCDMASGVAAFTKAEIRDVANSLATSLTLSIFDAKLRAPSVDTIDIDVAEALARAARPGEQFGANGGFGDADITFGSGTTDPPPGGTLLPVTTTVKADTSMRIVHGLYPLPAVSNPASAALYGEGAVAWQFGPGGVLVRISTTDPSTESVTRLQQLAQDIANLIPTTPGAVPADAIAINATTTSLLFDDGTRQTIAGVVVVDASDRSLGSDFAQYLQANGVEVLSIIPATRSFPETMLQPLEAGALSATQLDLLLNIGGFDTFTATEIDGELPQRATVVVVLGADGGPPSYRGLVNPIKTATSTTSIVGLQGVPP